MSNWRNCSEDQERFHIDSGPRPISALQVVSEALDIPSQHSQQQQDDSSQDHHGLIQQSESTGDYNCTKTIVASDSDVSNGFVKSGSSLPYVFEASESGVRKRSSKILPVCAVCGKRFVCVTTMKRHLVTHTGEKPFSCKVCGKQYTQKGNLRVHERTHRNDRPFECNICHQKFYRKEPMQKHQWRQHGIVHFKSRPLNQSATDDAPTPAPTPAATPVLVPPTPLTVDPPKPLIPLRPAKPSSYTALVDSLRANSRENSPYRSDPAPLAPPPAHSTTVTHVPKFTPPSSPDNELNNIEPNPNHAKIISINNVSDHSIEIAPPTTIQATPSFSYSSVLKETPNTHLLLVSSSSSTAEASDLHHPIKLKMKKAFQAAQELEQANHQPNHQPETLEVENDLNEMKIGQNNAEMVECQCKTCGNTFSVVDPYNFRCNNCHVKYTSLPTHLIADPLQCIGCCAVFPHKPALKAHQTVSDKERPFRCCKCGYGFRQKAHLQKHQWRIHRRKLEPDQNMKDAEAFFEVIQQRNPSNGTTITMQDIINKSVEKSIGEGPRSLMKTSSKYYSEVLGLEYEPKSSEDDDDSNSSNDQPLDLSPAKKLIDPDSLVFQQLNQPQPLPLNTNDNEEVATDFSPAWKKQKTSESLDKSEHASSSHPSLPATLQKPMSLVAYKHSSWLANPDQPQHLAKPKSLDSKNTFVRSQLELIKGGNTRTV